MCLWLALFGLLALTSTRVRGSSVEEFEVTLVEPLDFGASRGYESPFAISLFVETNHSNDVPFDELTVITTETTGFVQHYPQRSELITAVNPHSKAANATANATFSLTDVVICYGNLSTLGVWANASSSTTLCDSGSGIPYIVVVASSVNTLNSQCESQLHEACPVSCPADASYNTTNTTTCDSTSLRHLVDLFSHELNATHNHTLQIDPVTGEYDYFLLNMRWRIVRNHTSSVYTGGTLFAITPPGVPVLPPPPTSKATLTIVIVCVVAAAFAGFAIAGAFAYSSGGAMGYAPVNA
jgi:hypothetical protein